MEWINKNLFENYNIVGNIDGNVVGLYVEHPDGTKTVKEKHMSRIDADNCALDDIRQFFSNKISKIESLTIEQLQLYCGVKPKM